MHVEDVLAKLKLLTAAPNLLTITLEHTQSNISLTVCNSLNKAQWKM